MILDSWNLAYLDWICNAWFLIISAIKNGFSIASTEEGEIQISVDNVYPLLKALGLNPQNESVMDMVRDACMECK